MIHDIEFAGPSYVALLSKLPMVGSTVSIRTTDHPKRPVPYTIQAYMVGCDGRMIFKAYDMAGFSCIEPVTLLLH